MSSRQTPEKGRAGGVFQSSAVGDFMQITQNITEDESRAALLDSTGHTFANFNVQH